MTNTKIIGLLLVLVGTYSSCKPKAEDGSTVASLDNMTRDAGAKVSTNFCGIKMSKSMLANLSVNDRNVVAKRIDASSDDLRYAVAGSLTAVPKIMQQVFFATKGGKIKVVADVDAKCAAGKPSDAELRFFAESKKQGSAYDLDGCWSVENDSLIIYVKNDTKVIHHALLRLFASAYAEFFTARLDAVKDTLPAKYKAEMTRRVERFARQKASLAKALLDDLETANPKKAQRFIDLRQDDARAFATQVFVETIDSAYCSAASAHVMDTQFKSVSAVVNDGADALKKDFGEPAQ